MKTPSAGIAFNSVAQIREIIEGSDPRRPVEAMLVLRPRWKTADAVIDFIDTKLRPTGYRLVGAFERSSGRGVINHWFSASCGRLHTVTTCTSTM